MKERKRNLKKEVKELTKEIEVHKESQDKDQNE